MHGTTAGPSSPRRSDVLLSENSDGTCSYCGSYADGIDAKRQTAVCERCAQILSGWRFCKECGEVIKPIAPEELSFQSRMIRGYFAHLAETHPDHAVWDPLENR